MAESINREVPATAETWEVWSITFVAGPDLSRTARVIVTLYEIADPTKQWTTTYGPEEGAADILAYVNTANFSGTNAAGERTTLKYRLLEKLNADGRFPGTVEGETLP